MPRSMDYHEDLKLPPEAIELIAQGTREGISDEFSVRQIEVYDNAERKVDCLLEAPDEDAVRRHHGALDVPCGEVHQVDSPALAKVTSSRHCDLFADQCVGDDRIAVHIKFKRSGSPGHEGLRVRVRRRPSSS